MLFQLIHFVFVLQDGGMKEKSPIVGGLSPKSQSLQTDGNPIQELVRFPRSYLSQLVPFLGMKPSFVWTW